jgi:predicted  nucleic acid-binding Zn-ribbon protein
LETAHKKYILQIREEEMIEKFNVLIRLQSLNNKINELESAQKRREQDIQKKHVLIERKKALTEQKHEERIAAQKELDRKELDLKTNEDEISKYNSQLNFIKTNKEYTALVSEIGSKKADMSILEDEILGMMSKLEEANQGYEKAKESLNSEDESLKDLTKRVNTELRESDIEIEKVKDEQKKYIDLLDEHSLKQYNRLSNIKGGKAIVPVIGKVCGGCSMTITTQTLNELMGSNDLVFCRSCSRILYLDEKSN